MKKRYILLLITLSCLISLAFYWPNRWKYIVIHHSAGSYGNIEHLQKVHRQRQYKDPLDAIAYHYIIGNGNGLGDGVVASDRRKQYNIWGVHVSNANADKNFRGLGICIIGNIDTGHMTEKQFEALLQLTQELMDEYGVEKEHILFHGHIPGEQSACPGKNFPKERFLAAIPE